MRKLICVTVFFLGFLGSVTAQELRQYQYVRVPEKFDFLDEENKYQLNDLTAFLFEKFGFTALYEESTPEGVQPCDLLYAKVHNESGLFRAKLYVTLENCNNEILFTSKTGASREKDYKASYHEALRKAFKSIEELQHSFIGEVVIDPVVISKEDSVPAEVIVDPVISSEEREEFRNSRKGSPEESYAGTYSNGAVSYELKKSSTGYDLFKIGNSEPFARLIKSGSGENYLYSSENVSGMAFFDTQGNLIAEYLDPDSGQVITVTYRKSQ